MTRQEVDDVLKTLMSQTPAAGLLTAHPRYVAVPHTAPDSTVQGTGLSFAAGTSAASAAVIGVRSTDLPGTPPRGAPV